MSLGLLLLGAASVLTAALSASRRAPRLWLWLTLSGTGLALAAAVVVLATGATGEWRSSFPIGGDRLHLRLDGLGAFFLTLSAIIGGAGAVYASAYWPDRKHPRSAAAGRLWWSGLLLSLGLVLVAANSLQFLFGWELFTLCAYYLITLDRQRGEVRAAGWLYLGASHAGTLCLFAFFAAIAAATGGWDLGPMRERVELAPLFWLALAGFALKSGAFPLHIWLPSAHANAPSHVSALLSGVTIKMGIYGLVRFSGWMPLPAGAGWAVAALGGVSAVLGVAFALGQHDLKRLLAYHSVENIGIILLGLGFALVAGGRADPGWGRLALAGGLLHVWNHGLFKALLFLGAGSVLHATGTREMSRLGGLWRPMPWTAGLFTLGAVAIAGLPPLNGFVSEWLVYLGLFGSAMSPSPSAWGALPAAILLGVTGALALACFVKVCGVVFLGAPRSAAAERAHESSPLLLGPMGLLAALCVLLGLVPVLFWPALARAVGDWEPNWAGTPAPTPLATLSIVQTVLAAILVGAAVWLWRRSPRAGSRRALTWDCGYAQPTARTQYTAGSFAGIITEWFGWILRPEKREVKAEAIFPKEAAHAGHTPETVLERIVGPFADWVMLASNLTRRLQHGRLQAYLFYLVVGLAGLALLVVTGDGQ